MSGTNFFTRSLLALQFSISLAAIIAGFIFAQNAKYQEQYDLGFDTDGIVYAYVGNGQDYRKLYNAIRDNAGIKNLAGSSHNISNSWYTDPLKAEGQEFDVDIMNIGDQYLPTVGAEIIAGRNFREDSEYDVERAAIINEEVMRLLGWTDALDRRIVLKDTIELSVVGVVKNIFFQGALWDPLEPMVLRAAQPDEYRYLVARTDLANAKRLKQDLETAWRQVFPNKLPVIDYFDEELVQSQEVNSNIYMLFMFLAVVAALLSVIGLFSMVSMNINKNMKQIGIRKILGAPNRSLAFRISREFIFILVASVILGCLSGYYLSDLLLGQIWAYHIEIGAKPLILSSLLLLLACGMTIGRLIRRATSTIPVELLSD